MARPIEGPQNIGTVLAKAHMLERGNDGLDLSFDGGMMASFIEICTYCACDFLSTDRFS